MTRIIAISLAVLMSADFAAAGETEARATAVRDLVAASRPFSDDYFDDGIVTLQEMSATLPVRRITGEWIGLARFSAKGAELAKAEIDAIEAEGLGASADMPLLLTRLAAKHQVVVHYVAGHWLDVDTFSDLADARNFT